MGTRVYDESGNVVHEAHGTAYTDELEQAYKLVDMTVNNERKRDQAQKFIYRAKQSADSISKLQRRLDGMVAEHNKILAALESVKPDGYSIEFLAQSEASKAAGDPAVPARLVAPEDATVAASGNKFDAIALAAAQS